MCGRYAYVPSRYAWASIDRMLGKGVADTLRRHEARYNVAPTATMPIVVHEREGSGPEALEARWGFIPHWWSRQKLPTHTINARREQASGKPMWRDAWVHHRCLIPATHYYEWQILGNGKQPYAVTMDHGTGFMFAGLWSWWTAPEGTQLATFAILTASASEAVAHIHERMPVILDPGGWQAWIEPAQATPGQIADILRGHLVTGFEAFPVRTLVNSPGNAGPEVLAALALA